MRREEGCGREGTHTCPAAAGKPLVQPRSSCSQTHAVFTIHQFLSRCQYSLSPLENSPCLCYLIEKHYTVLRILLSNLLQNMANITDFTTIYSPSYHNYINKKSKILNSFKKLKFTHLRYHLNTCQKVRVHDSATGNTQRDKQSLNFLKEHQPNVCLLH